MTQSKLIKNKQTLNKNGLCWCYFNHPETCLQWPSVYPGSKSGCVVAGTGPWSAVSVASSRRKRDHCYTFPVHCSLSRLRPELVSGLQPLPLPTHASSRLLKLSCVSTWILSSAHVVETCQTSVYILYLLVDLKKGLFFHRQNKICCFVSLEEIVLINHLGRAKPRERKAPWLDYIATLMLRWSPVVNWQSI